MVTPLATGATRLARCVRWSYAFTAPLYTHQRVLVPGRQGEFVSDLINVVLTVLSTVREEFVLGRISYGNVSVTARGYNIINI